MAQRVGTVTALLFHDRGTRRGRVVSSTPRQHFTPGKDPVPIVQEAGWVPEPVWTGGKSRPHRDSIPDRPGHSQSLYRLGYRARVCVCVCICMYVCIYIYIEKEREREREREREGGRLKFRAFKHLRYIKQNGQLDVVMARNGLITNLVY